MKIWIGIIMKINIFMLQEFGLWNHEKNSLGRLWSMFGQWTWPLAICQKLVSSGPSQSGLTIGRVGPSRPN